MIGVRSVRPTRRALTCPAFSIVFSVAACAGFAGTASAGQETAARPSATLQVTVEDETGVAVSRALLTLEQTQPPRVLKGETDYAGRCDFTGLSPGAWQLRVEKVGYYAVTHRAVQVGETANVDVTLNHVREYNEVVNVVYSPPAIDPGKTAASESLDSEQIIDLPFSVPRDIRYALPLLPGVLQDPFSQVHIDGSSTRQILDQLDGFNITDPTTGLFNMRVSVDALRSASVESSRYPVEFGKGSGGVIDLATGMGDDRFRYSATDFVPSIQQKKGLHFNTFTPRGSITGPIRKGKGWFLDALDGEYELNIINELPKGADQNPAWRINNLAKAQVNLTSSNILTTEFVVNQFGSDHIGISRFNPQETTVNEKSSSYLLGVKDQALLPGGGLLEAGVAYSTFYDSFDPLGTQLYVINPEGTSGNYYETFWNRASRMQGIANVIFPARQWLGTHEFKVGLDIDRITDDQNAQRGSIEILREDGTLSRRITFTGAPPFTRTNVEAGAYAQDRWSVSGRWLLEPGVRFDWDRLLRDALVSPRVATTYLLRPNGDTKLSAGVGIYYDASNLDILTRSLTGERTDYFYDSAGTTLVRPPLQTTFQIDPRTLNQSRFLNWSVALEQKLPRAIYLKTQFVQKRGANGWAFVNLGTSPFSGSFALRNVRQDHYDAVEVTARRTFKGQHFVFASYTRSAARSTAVLNFNIDNPLFSQQAGGPLPWDTPNRVVTWGLLPLLRKFDLAYSADWRDGFPFSLVNQDQQLVGVPGSRRFPTYFSLNMYLERRVHLFGYEWAVRGGFDDITNRHNPFAVDNNVNSPNFLTYSAIQGRAMTGRVRLLGRK